MSAPLPLAVYGLVHDRLHAWINPFATLDLGVGDDDQLD